VTNQQEQSRRIQLHPTHQVQKKLPAKP